MREDLKEKCKYLCSGLAVIVGIFLIVLTVGEVIDIKNKVQPIGSTITFSGTGEIFAKPDLITTSFSVLTQAKTVAEALSENTKKMNAVIDFMKSQGVAEKDLKTTNFNIFPRYEFQRVEIQIYPFPPGKNVLVGYEVDQSLEVKIRDLSKVGQILQGGADEGANQIGDLSFTVDKADELKSQARKQAIDQARAKAKELTSQLGVRLGKVVSFSENGGYPIIFGFAKEASQSAGGGTPQIETGENKIEVTVSITYEIR
jgi:hypothetical protein